MNAYNERGNIIIDIASGILHVNKLIIIYQIFLPSFFQVCTSVLNCSREDYQ